MRKHNPALVCHVSNSQHSPPLRTAPVFGGITGIMSQEVAEVAEEGSNIPSLSNKSRENGELQDMYRRTLAASWVAQPGASRSPRVLDEPQLIFPGRNYEPTTVSRTYLLAVMVGAHISTMFNAPHISLPVATKTNPKPTI